jgi:hypothetical protein
LESDAVNLVVEQQFMSGRFRVHQNVRILEFASTERHIALSSSSIAWTFEVSHSAIVHAKVPGDEDLPGPGRHPQLDSDCEQELIDWIANKATNNTAVKKTELLHECHGKFGKKITRDQVDSFAKRRAEELVETKRVPQENPRLEVPPVLLETAIEGLRDDVHHRCAELAIISVVTCISAAEKHMGPFFVCSPVIRDGSRQKASEWGSRYYSNDETSQTGIPGF